MATSIRDHAAVRSCPKQGTKPAKARRCQRQELIAAASGAVLLLVIGVLSGWAHHSLSTAQGNLPRAVATLPASPPTASAPTRGELRTWLTQAEPSIIALAAARDQIASPAADNDVAGTGAACQNAQGALADVRRHLPSPDPALNTVLQRAIDSYDVGLRYCIAGAANHDGNDLGQAAAYIRSASIDLQAAIDITDRVLPDFPTHDPTVMTV